MYSNSDKKFKQKKKVWLELLHQRPNPPLPLHQDYINDMDCWLRQSCLICLINNFFKVVIDVSFLLACASLIYRIHLHSANMRNYFLSIFRPLLMIWSSDDTSVRGYFCNLSSNILNSISWILFQRLLFCVCIWIVLFRYHYHRGECIYISTYKILSSETLVLIFVSIKFGFGWNPNGTYQVFQMSHHIGVC